MSDDDARWRSWLAAVRRQSDPRATTDDRRAVAEFAAELLRIAARMARTPGTPANALTRREQGAVQWEIACDRKVFGDTDSVRPLKSLMVAMADLDATGELQSPRAVAVTALKQVALSELRKPRMMAVDEHTEDASSSMRERAAGIGDAGLGPEVDPAALPAAVAATLRHCARLAPVYALVVQPVNAAPWSQSAEFIERDVALGVDRVRWPDGTSTLDHHACAWQATYHGYEDHLDHTHPDEIPDAGAPDRGRFDQHASRFRKLWRTADGSAVETVNAMPGEVVDGAGRVPAQWYAPQHPTLRGRGAAGGLQ